LTRLELSDSTKIWLGHQMGLDTKTDWLTDHQLQCDFDFDPLVMSQSPASKDVSTELQQSPLLEAVTSSI
jgi:hypothetical protein